MSYYCKDCSYRGISSGRDGGCPACGSFNISRVKREEKEPPGKRRLVLLIALWAYLIGMIIWKLYH